MLRVDKYVLRTNRPGMPIVDIFRAPKHQERVDLEKEDKLRDVVKRADVPAEARVYHENKDYFGKSPADFKAGTPDESLVLDRVPEFIEDEYGEKVPNDKGLIELDKAEDVIFIMNMLRQSTGDLKVGLEKHSKKLTAAELAQILDLPGEMTQKSDVDKRRHMKVKNK